MQKFHWYRLEQKALGLSNFLKLRIGLPVGSPHLRHPVRLRPGSSDKSVFHQIFIGREYRCLDGLQSLQFIVDAGANAGFSSAYFLSRYQKAKVFAVEPDAGNLRQAQANCASYGDRFASVLGAVWAERKQLNFEQETMELGDEWGRQVSSGGEIGNIEGYTMADVINMSGFPRICLLKMDVEGAEREIFAGDTSWLSLVDNIVIELHGEEASRIFHAAIESHGFQITTCDELTVCLR